MFRSVRYALKSATRYLLTSRNFADNVGIKFQTPEEFFLHEAPRPFTQTFEPSGYITEADGKYITNELAPIIYLLSPSCVVCQNE
jgi:hypothetical protein